MRQRLDRIGADQPIAHVGARQHRRNNDLGRPDGLHVLHRVDAGIHLARGKGAIEFLGPQCLAADLRQRTILDAIAGRANDDDLDIVKAMRGDQRIAHHARLGKCKRRAARP